MPRARLFFAGLAPAGLKSPLPRLKVDYCGVRESFQAHESHFEREILVLAQRLGLTAEGQPAFPGDLRPKFAEDVETHVLQDAVDDPLRCGSETAFVVRVVCIAQHDRARRAQPFGKIEHAMAIVAVGHDRVLDGMEKPPPGGAMGQAVVARVLRKHPGIRKVLKEPGRGLPGKFGAKALPIPLGPLSIAGVRVFGLVDPGAETGSEERHRVQ